MQSRPTSFDAERVGSARRSRWVGAGAWLGLALVVAGLNLFPASARGQSGNAEAPYAPKRFETSTLIDFGTYEESPFDFPWKIESIEEIAVHSRIDFRYEFDASYDEISTYFTEAHHNQTPAVTLKAKSSPTSESIELKVYGLAESDEGERFTLGHADLMRRFYLDLRQDGDKVFVIFRNASHTRLFSGLVPKRTPFKPVRAATIPLR